MPIIDLSLTDIQFKILKLLKISPLTRDEICEGLGFFHYEYTHKKYLDGISGERRKITSAYKRKTYSQRTTIYDNLIKLQKKKRVEKFTRSTGKRGRPLVLWRLII